jgi:hypothetical protein
MSWFSRIFGSKADEQHPSDPIFSKCRSIEREYNLLLDDQERKHLLVNREKLAKSSLRGRYVQPDVFHVLCFLCLFDALCETGVELLETGARGRAVKTLEKARRLLSWPSVIYSLMMVYDELGEKEAVTRFRSAALEGFDTRLSLLSVIVPASLPSRDEFIRMIAERLDTTGPLLLGFSDMEALRRELMQV